MTGSAVSRREKSPDNTRYECFILETFSMNILCTEMSGREQQSGAWPLTVAPHTVQQQKKHTQKKGFQMFD